LLKEKIKEDKEVMKMNRGHANKWNKTIIGALEHLVEKKEGQVGEVLKRQILVPRVFSPRLRSRVSKSHRRINRSLIGVGKVIIEIERVRCKSIVFRAFLYSGSLAGCEDRLCSWVRNVGRLRGERGKDMQLSVYIGLCIFIYLINKHNYVDVSLGRG
jgi:hypothetical protein